MSQFSLGLRYSYPRESEKPNWPNENGESDGVVVRVDRHVHLREHLEAAPAEKTTLFQIPLPIIFSDYSDPALATVVTMTNSAYSTPIIPAYRNPLTLPNIE